ncbi:hypothetical protein DXG01_005379 [Tephrocybe rancida]|nr:hypothetical protein DXG01_005379 [Tephrocybe rancida]
MASIFGSAVVLKLDDLSLLELEEHLVLTCICLAVPLPQLRLKGEKAHRSCEASKHTFLEGVSYAKAATPVPTSAALFGLSVITTISAQISKQNIVEAATNEVKLPMSQDDNKWMEVHHRKGSRKGNHTPTKPPCHPAIVNSSTKAIQEARSTSTNTSLDEEASSTEMADTRTKKGLTPLGTNAPQAPIANTSEPASNTNSGGSSLVGHNNNRKHKRLARINPNLGQTKPRPGSNLLLPHVQAAMKAQPVESSNTQESKSLLTTICNFKSTLRKAALDSSSSPVKWDSVSAAVGSASMAAITMSPKASRKFLEQSGFCEDGVTPWFYEHGYYSIQTFGFSPFTFVAPLEFIPNGNHMDYSIFEVYHEESERWIPVPFGCKPHGDCQPPRRHPDDHIMPIIDISKEYVFYRHVPGEPDGFMHTTEEEDNNEDMELQDEVVPKDEVLQPRLDKGKARAVSDDEMEYSDQKDEWGDKGFVMASDPGPSTMCTGHQTRDEHSTLLKTNHPESPKLSRQSLGRFPKALHNQCAEMGAHISSKFQALAEEVN